ncbi:MAG: Ig-like domain-containing protein [Candidatus Thiodiazotropha endolucinida]
MADVDSSDFDTGTLTVSFQAGSDNAEDVLAIRDQGAGASNITVSGSAVSYGGTQIGTFTGGSGGTDLVITLDADADATAVSALVRNITYENTDIDNPTTGARTVRFVLTDGDGATSVDYDTTVTVSTVNDDPTITDLGGDALVYSEGDGAQVIDQGAASAVADVDSSDFDTGTLTVSFQSGSDNAEDVLAIRDQGAGPSNITVSGSTVSYGGTQIGTFTGGSGGTDLVVTLDADADAIAVGTLIRNITYENTDTDDPTTGARTVRFVLTDGDGGTSIDYDTTVTVSGVNDAPTDLILSVSTELSDEQVNSNETGDQSRPQIAVLNSGSYVIVWNDNSGLDGDGSGVFAQLYDANGNTLGSEFQVNTTTSNPQNLHSVIALQDGGFAVGMQTDRGGGVYYSTIRTFDASGNPTSGEIDVDVYGYRTQLTQLQDGNLFVTYVDTSGTDDISFTVITPSGSTVVGETQIASITSWAPNPYVTTLDSGDVAVTWRDGATNQAMTRVYQADGTPLGAAVAYGGTNVQDSFNNSVSVSATTSGFVTAYEDGGDIYIQHWNNDGSLSGSPVVVANDADVQGAPSVESLSDGTLLVVWQSANQDGSGLGAYAQHLSVTGDLYGSAQLINTTTSGDQGLPRIAELNNGDIIATWQSDNLDTDGKAVAQKVLSFSPFVAEDASNGTVVASVTDVIDPDAGDSHTFSLVDDAGGAFDINPTTGVITVANSNLIDYESATSMDVTVRATDGGSLSHDEVVTIQIVNVNEDPTNAGSLPSDIAVTEDVSSEIDLSALDFADVDAGAGTLTVTLTTSTGGNLSAAAGTGITVGGTSTARTLTGTLTDLNNYFNTASNITYLHGTANTDGNDADTINVTINDNGNTGSGGGTDIDLGTVNVDITAVNDDPSNAGSLPSDIAVTEDVSSNVDLSAVDFADVDAASGTLTVTLTTSTGGNLSADAGTGITLGGTPTALTLTGTLTDLNNYFNTTSNITYLHGTANTNGNDADTINVTINDNGNTGTGGGIDVDLGTVNVDIGVVNDTPTLAATAANDTLTENSDTTSGAVFATVTIDPIEAGDDIASAQLTLGGGIENSDILTINSTAISGLGSNSSGAISGGHSYSYTQATGVITITFAGGTNAAAAELVLESITYGIDPAADNPSTTARTVTLNTVTDNGGGSDTSSDISETATISVSAVNDDPTNSGSLPSDIAVTEDVSSNVDLSAIDLSDVDVGAGTLTVTLTTGTGGDLSAAAGAGITLGGTPTALTLTGTLTDLNNYFNTTSNITYLHGTANTAGDNADTINVTINDNGNTGMGGGTDINLGTVNVDITAVNDAPVVVDLDGDIHNFTEGDGVVLIEQGGDAVVSDSDSSDYAGGSLTVEVDSGLQSAEDRFSIFNQGTDTGEIGLSGGNVTYSGTLIGTVTGGTGIDPLTVTFNSNATSAAVTALVRNITYENSNLENPTDGTRSVTIDITDGDGGGSQTQNLTLNVSSVNDAPVVDLNGADGAGADFAATFTEDGGAVNVVDTDATISDVDNTTYQNLSINLVGFPDGASEQLTIAGYAFTYGVSDNVIRTVGSTDFEIDFDGTGINVMRDGGGGMPEADLQTLLRGITYENTSQDPTAGDRTINIFAQDSSLLSGPIATSTITVNPQNDAPTATDNANSVSENGFVSGNVITDDSGSGVDSDPEGDGLQVTQVEGGAYTPGLPITLASGAQVTFQANGSYTYNTNGQFEGLGAGDSVDDNFTYQIGDGNGGFDTATVTITINGSNNTPSITSADLTLDEGQTVTLGDANFAVTDVDDTDFTYTVSGISGGYFQLSTNPGVSITSFTSTNLTGGLVQFVDDGNEVAPAFSITVNDGDIDSNTLAATINFTLVSDSTPIANNDSITVAEGGTVTTLDGGFSTVLNNDTGLVDAPVTVSLVTDVTNGSLTLNGDGTFSYTHDGTENFTDSFTYRVTDNDGQTADATVTINITPVSDATPVANADSITVAEGGTTTTLVGGSSTVLNNDTGLGDTPVTVSLVTDVVNGTLTLNGDGTFSYTHDGTENFTDSFTYRVTDNDGQTADATVTINVTPVSDETPVANADSITVAEGATATTLVGGSSTVLNNDTGLGDTPVIVSLITNVTNGSLTLNGDGTFSYTHDGSENFTDSFTYRITDNDGETADATVTINITPVSDATPVANADSITVAEGATATTLVGGSSTVLNNDIGLGDTPVTVSLVTDVTNGTLTLNGDGTFSYTHDGSENFTDSFTYRVTDNDGQTADATVTINVTPVSDETPVANADSITVAEGGTVTTLVGGSSTVLNNDTGLGDTPVTVSLVTDVVNGTLTLNGDGTFSYTHDGTENFTDSFTYRVTDNDGQTADATVTINVTPVSDTTPVANADSITVAEGATATTLVGGSSTVLNNDTGLGDTPVTVSLVTDVTNGTLTLNGDGTFSYTHDGSENFTDSFTYRVTDNDGQTADATVTINVTPVSDTTPVANADSITVAEGATATTLVGGSSTVLNNDTGLGDTPVTVSLVTDVMNGTLTLNGDGTFSYTHDGSENFTDSFTYRVTDNDGETADATVTINVTPVSDTTPVANADSITVAEGATATTLVGGSSTVLNNDTGLGDTPVTVSLVTDVTNGSLTLNSDGTFSYTHDGSENFTDSFTYRVTDNDGQTADATVTINITPVSDATPVANADSITVAEGATATTLVGGSSTVLNNDTGLGDTPVTVSLVTDVTNGSLTLNGDGTFSYTHDGSENFTDSFTYRVTDNDGETADATVTINVTPVSDTTPVANADSITVAEGGTTTTLVGGSSTVLNNDTGLGDTPVTVSLVTDVTNGSLTLNGDGTFSYTHDGTENFTDSFTYRVTDNDGQTADATVTINITPVSDATPIANADSITVAEGGTTTTLVGGSSTVLNNDTGLGDTPVTVSLVTDVTNGSLTLNGDGTFSYTHDGSENFTDSFTYRVTDNDGETADATVTINITPVSDATPIANADSITVAEGGTTTTLVGGSSTVLNNDTGLGDTPMTVSLVTDVTNGSLTLNSDGTFSYTHDGSENFNDSFTYRVTDNDGQTGDATVTINVTPVSDATPVANADSITVAEGATATTLVGGSSMVLNNDTGLGDTPVTVSLVTDVTNGSLTLNSDGTFSYTHDGSENFTDSFTYRVTDNDGQTADATVTINITPVSDATPVANADSITVAEGGTITTLVGGSSTVLNNDTGLGDTPVIVSLITDVTNGSLTLNGDGTFSYTHDGSENFTDSFTYRITDNDGETADATVTINITPVSDATPVANADSITVAEGATATTLVGGSSTVLNNDTGLGDTPVTVSLVTDVTNGALTLNSDGTFSYTHDGSENFTDSFTYRVTDNDGETADATVTINITPVSDQTPVANADSITVAEGATATTLVGGSSTVLNNDTGLGDTPVTVSLVTDVTNGTLILNTDGTFSYTHDGSENFTDSFTYRVTDNDGETADATVTINVTPVSDTTPVANADSITVAEGATATTLVGGSSTVLNNDTGLGDTPVTVSLVTDVTNGTLTLNGDGTFSYTHDGSENFTDSFTYRITDNDGETTDATVTINVTPVSDATPVANADSITVAEGATATTLVGGSSTVLNNDTGLGDTPVTVSLVTDVTNGALTLNSDGTFSYTHDGSENFTDSFTYRVTDNDGETADATVTINITPVSDQTPVANADSITVAEGATATTLVGGSSTVLNNDTGLGDTPVTVSLVTDVTNGTLILNTDGTFSYTHDGSENFTDSFTYRVTDNDGETADATVTINVTPVSDTTPVANADSITVAEGATATTLVGGSSTVLNNDTGLGDTPVTVSLVTDVTNGTLTLNGDGTFSYTHDGSENFTDSFTYRITDNDGETTDATVTINVTPVSDATPVANADSITVAEGATATTLVGGSSTVLNNDTGLSDTPVTVSLITDVTNGILTLNSDGTFSYTHDGSDNFTDSFTYRVTDNDGETADAMVTINVISNNNPPEASDTNFSVLEDNVYTGNLPAAVDDDGDTVTYRLESNPVHGSITLDMDGGFSYTPDADYHGADSFIYSVSDGNGGNNSYLVEIDVVSVNDSPVITSHDENENVLLSLEENATLVTMVTADDPENDAISFAIDGGADLGLFSIDPMSGEMVFNHAPDMENPLDADQDNLYQVQVLVSDGNGGTDRQSFTIEVTDVDEFDVGLLMDVEDTPDEIPLSGSLSDGVGITVWAEDPDSSNNRITYSLDDDSNGLFAIDPAYGTITLASTLDNRDASQFEITVRATSEDGSYSLHTFHIAFNRVIDTTPEPEPPYLDEIIFDLDPEESVESQVTTGPSQQPPTDADTVSEELSSEDQEASLSTGIEERTRVVIDDIERPAIKRLSPSLFPEDSRNSYRYDYYQARLTPVPIAPEELPVFDTSIGELIEVPEAIWHLLDSMNSEMSEHQREQVSTDKITVQTATFGTLALSAGYVAWLLRAGVLSASLLSFTPLWRQIDPLPVLSAHAKRRDEDQDHPPEEDPDEKRLAKLFDRKKKPRKNRFIFFRKDS